jgi:hypothetical protein
MMLECDEVFAEVFATKCYLSRALFFGGKTTTFSKLLDIRARVRERVCVCVYDDGVR